MLNKVKIIVFANYNYLPVLENWLEAIDSLQIENILIISLDQELHKHLQERNIPSLLRVCELDLGKLWIHRVKVILELMETGYDVIHSDADAVWLKNPLEYLNNIQEDMVFSQGTFWPKDVHKEWGFVLCCGFFYIKNNTRTIKFMKELYKRVLLDKDDQVSCNRILFEKNIQWNIKDKYFLKYREVPFLCSQEIIVGRGKEISIAVLPHSKFQRVHEKEKEAYVKHIISEKNADSIINILEDTGCLFIDKNREIK